MFAPLDCSGGLITLGHARAQTLVASIPGNVIAGLPINVLYPQPLADQLAGRDLDPGMADIVATFNGGINDCDPNIDWYYGLDANAGSLTDLVEVVVHELGHGLGFASGVDMDTGELNIGIPDTFSSHIYDNAMGMAWLDMTAQQRLASMRNARHLVWSGANAIRAAAQVLSKGAPTIVIQSPVSAFLGNLSETNFGPLLKDVTTTLTGPLVVANPIGACTPVASRAGGIFLILGNSPCSALNQADYATSAGARAVLLTDRNGFSPASSVELPPSQLRDAPDHHPGRRDKHQRRAGAAERRQRDDHARRRQDPPDRRRCHGAAVSLRQRSGPARVDGVALGSAGAPGPDPGAGVRVPAPARRHHGDRGDA